MKTAKTENLEFLNTGRKPTRRHIYQGILEQLIKLGENKAVLVEIDEDDDIELARNRLRSGLQREIKREKLGIGFRLRTTTDRGQIAVIRIAG